MRTKGDQKQQRQEATSEKKLEASEYFSWRKTAQMEGPKSSFLCSDWAA